MLPVSVKNEYNIVPLVALKDGYDIVLQVYLGSLLIVTSIFLKGCNIYICSY